MRPRRAQTGSLGDRLLNRISGLFGRDRELDDLSREVTDIKNQAYADHKLTRAELDHLYQLMAEVETKYAKYAAARGFPVGAARPTSKKAFKVYQEQMEIRFEWLAGKDLRGGELKGLVAAAKASDEKKTDEMSRAVAFDLLASPNPATSIDKVRLLRSRLASLSDPSSQRGVLSGVRRHLEDAIAVQFPPGEGRVPPITPQAFDLSSGYQGVVSVQRTALPESVRQSNKLFPNRPLPGWEATARQAVQRGLDELDDAGELFVDRVPVGGEGATVALKLDLNLGAEGPPSVSDPAATAATISELLERAAKQGKVLRFTVGDSSGGENIPMGRTSMDILRDTGNYHYALKAGLVFAISQGDSKASLTLAKITAAEDRGVYFGSRQDTVSTAADLAAVARAASKYVVPVDYDQAGFVAVDPNLGPIGLAAWGTRQFQMARPWVEADFRVHVSRGLSTHFLAGWTGAQKGLIGLHAFGLRPVDQGADKLGANPVNGLTALTHAGGFMAIFQNRTGLSDIGSMVAASKDPELKSGWAACEKKWQALKKNATAWRSFESEILKLSAELKRDQQAGHGQPEVAEKMRRRTRAALDRADLAAPGFKNAFWDAVSAGTKFGLVNGRHFRGALPTALRDEDTGRRIGLLSHLPYQSDLVVQTQPKIGEGGGPDAYAEVRDVGAILVGLREADTDAIAWQVAGKKENMWDLNFPAQSALVFGPGPINENEILLLGGPT